MSEKTYFCDCNEHHFRQYVLELINSCEADLKENTEELKSFLNNIPFRGLSSTREEDHSSVSTTMSKR